MVVPGVSIAQDLNNWERVKASAFLGLDDMSLERCDGCVTGWSWCRKDYFVDSEYWRSIISCVSKRSNCNPAIS